MRPTSLVQRRRSRLALFTSLAFAVVAVGGAGAVLAGNLGPAGPATAAVTIPGATPDPSPPPASSSPEDPIANDPGVVGGPALVGPNDGALRVTPEPGIVDARPARIDRQVVSKDGFSVDVYFWGGVETCYGIADTQATWGPDGSVNVRILEGRRAVVDQPCIDIAMLKVVTIPLAHDLPLLLDQ